MTLSDFVGVCVVLVGAAVVATLYEDKRRKEKEAEKIYSND